MKPAQCTSCGLPHDPLSYAIPTSMPTALAEVPTAQRTQRAEWNQDYCVLDEERFFVYGSLSLPINGHPAPFIWGTWAEVSAEQLELLHGLRGVKGRESHPPIAAVLATDIPFYPRSTLGLPISIVIQPAGTRPEFLLNPGDHAVISEQATGVPPEHIVAITNWFRTLKQGSRA